MPYHTFVSSLFFLLSRFLSFFLSFAYPFCFFSFSFLFLSMFLFFLIFPFSSVVSHCAQLRLFILSVVIRFILACCGCPFLVTHWSAGCPTTTTTLCWLCHVPFLDKKEFCFIFLAFRSIPI